MNNNYFEGLVNRMLTGKPGCSVPCHDEVTMKSDAGCSQMSLPQRATTMPTSSGSWSPSRLTCTRKALDHEEMDQSAQPANQHSTRTCACEMYETR